MIAQLVAVNDRIKRGNQTNTTLFKRYEVRGFILSV